MGTVQRSTVHPVYVCFLHLYPFLHLLSQATQLHFAVHKVGSKVGVTHLLEYG